MICRCAAFIGVCVEFVAAVAWLAELFPNPKQRERVLGYTQAFASLGGMMVAGAYYVINQTYQSLPAIYDGHAQWRYALISALIPALPLLLIRPFLPESPVWKQKRAAGTLQRPSILELFKPEYRRTSIVTALLFMCSFGVAFGAIQMTPQLVPGLLPDLKLMGPKRTAYESAQKPEKLAKLLEDKDKAAAALAAKPDDAALKDKADKARKLAGMALGASKDEAKQEALKSDIEKMLKIQEDQRDTMQFYQETGGLVGRLALAFLATVIVSRRLLLWLFQVPALFIIPLVFLYPAAGKLDAFLQHHGVPVGHLRRRVARHRPVQLLGQLPAARLPDAPARHRRELRRQRRRPHVRHVRPGPHQLCHGPLRDRLPDSDPGPNREHRLCGGGDGFLAAGSGCGRDVLAAAAEGRGRAGVGRAGEPGA